MDTRTVPPSLRYTQSTRAQSSSTLTYSARETHTSNVSVCKRTTKKTTTPKQNHLQAEVKYLNQSVESSRRVRLLQFLYVFNVPKTSALVLTGHGRNKHFHPLFNKLWKQQFHQRVIRFSGADPGTIWTCLHPSQG